MKARETYINSITKILATLRFEIELRNSVNLTDLNIHAENFYRDLFNLVYGLGLGNLNARKQNKAYIDLIDEKNKVAIQVTSVNRADKISKTIEGFLSNKENNGYKLKVLLIAKQAKNYRKKFPHNDKFDPEKDVTDIEKLLKDIADKEIEKLQSIAGFLEENIGNSSGKYRKVSAGMLEGAERIDTAFIEKIKNGPKFSRSKFYSAKQEDDCQWYGVLNRYDIERKIYPEVREAVRSSFSFPTVYKVAAIVHGVGGCGKSTLLRRLAIEAAQTYDLKVYWVSDSQFEYFANLAIEKIEADSASNYLVFIEDWYRLTDGNKKLGDEVLKRSQEISNIRLVIGDRNITGKDYLENRIDPNKTYELGTDENREIINKIVSEYPEWRDAATRVLTSEKAYNSALFIILFVLAGVSEGRIEEDEIRFNDLLQTARSIAKHDLKRIYLRYPGLAKALHYWACVYDAYKAFITWETFLKIADDLDISKKTSGDLVNWQLQSPLMNRLKLYINVGVNENLAARYQKLEFVQFNHDKLAEDILSKIKLNEDWEDFDDLLKKRLLNLIAEKGDEYSASSVVHRFIASEPQLFKDSIEKKELIDTLFFVRKNRNFQYLNVLVQLNLPPEEIFKYIEILESEGLYNQILWQDYFKRAEPLESERAAKNLLLHENFFSIPEMVILSAFKQLGNEKEKEKIARNILTNIDPLRLQEHIIIAAFKQGGNHKEKIEAAKVILTNIDPLRLQIQKNITIAAFKQSGNNKEKIEAAKVILTNIDLFSLQEHIIIAAFKQDGNDREKIEAANIIINHENLPLHSINHLVAVFKQIGNEHEKLEVDKAIFNPKNLTAHILVGKVYQQQKRWDEAEIILGKCLEMDPDNLFACVELSKVYQHQERWDEAEIILGKCLEIDPDNFFACFELGKVYLQQERRDEAEIILGICLQKLNPDRLFVCFELNKVYQHQERWDKAEEILFKCLEIDPDNFFAYFELGKIYLQRESWGEAENILSRCYEINPDHFLVCFELGKIYQQQKRWDEAEMLLSKCLEIDPDNFVACVELGKVYQHRERWDKAEEILCKCLEIDPDNLFACVELGKVYQHQERWGKAEEILCKCLEIDPDNFFACFELSKVYQQHRRWDEAETALKECIRIEPKNLTARTELGKLYYNGNRLSEAEEILLECLEIDEMDTFSRIELSKIYQRLQRFDEAEKRLKECLVYEIDSKFAKLELAFLYQRTFKSNLRAKLIFEILALEPDNIPTLTQASRIFIERRKYRVALKILERALNLRKQDIITIIEIIQVYARLGDEVNRQIFVEKAQNLLRKTQKPKYNRLFRRACSIPGTSERLVSLIRVGVAMRSGFSCYVLSDGESYPLIENAVVNNKVKQGIKVFFGVYEKDMRRFANFVEPYFENIDDLEALR